MACNSTYYALFCLSSVWKIDCLGLYIHTFQLDAYPPLVDRIPACTGPGEGVCVSQHALGRGCLLRGEGMADIPQDQRQTPPSPPPAPSRVRTDRQKHNLRKLRLRAVMIIGRRNRWPVAILFFLFVTGHAKCILEYMKICA